MVGFIIGWAIIIYIIYMVMNEDKRVQAEMAQKKAQKEREKREFEQQTSKKIRATVDKIPASKFYKELLPALKFQIQTDVKEYLGRAYDEYMRTPHATPNGFRPFAEMSLDRVAGYAIVTSDGVYYDRNSNMLIGSSLKWCKFKFDCSNHGYSKLDSIQQWALAWTLSKDLGYRSVEYRREGVDFRDSDYKHLCIPCRDTLSDAIDYLKRAKSEKIYIDLQLLESAPYLDSLIDLETERLQNSGISYKSPF